MWSPTGLQPGVVVHTSPFLRVDMAGAPALQETMEQLAAQLAAAGIPARVVATEAQVMWAKLVRLNALACTTSAWDVELGVIREDPGAARDPGSGDPRGRRRRACRRGRHPR